MSRNRRAARPKTATETITFRANGHSYSLPPISAVLELPTRVLRELVKGGASNDANLEIAFTIIEASDDREMVEAFFDLPIKESAKVINKWMLAAQHEGASLPQS